MDVLALPATVTARIEAEHGAISALERLGGMSVARVYRVGLSEGGAIVVKGSARTAETQFYDCIAPALRTAGLPLPLVYWTAHAEGEHWFAMEMLGETQPLGTADDQWEPDPRIVRSLALLHRETAGKCYEFPRLPGTQWDEAVSDSALRVFYPGDLPRLRSAFAGLASLAAARLVPKTCWISGDPSPPNWASRDDGSLAWIDWELFREGVPAEDLAPAVPGLAPARAFRRMAPAYVQATGDSTPDPEQLAADIALAKIVTVVMLLRAVVEEPGVRVPEAYVENLRLQFPSWLEDTTHEFQLSSPA
ncbi:hypothetical protein AYO38_12015 [bacterium SCGC AG-212-C10]|nr:hypothetical protein AYO38_12015 [bacterium SCGC AG-212-C10]